MVRQTAKGLGANDIIDTARGSARPFRRLKTILHRSGCRWIRWAPRRTPDHKYEDGGVKFLLFLSASVAAPRIFSTCPDPHLSDFGGRFLRAEMLRLVNLVVEAVQHEIEQIRYNGFSAFRFQQFYQMVVCCRGRNLTRISPTMPTRGFFSSVIGIRSKSSTISRHILLELVK